MAVDLNKCLTDSVAILKGNSKKSGREYSMLIVKKNSQFNNILIDMLESETAIEVIDIRNKATV